MKRLLLYVCLILTGAVVRADAERELSVYFIGNSLTASTTLDRVHGLFAQRRIDLRFGSQLSAGKSLLRHLHYAKEPDQKWACWETTHEENGKLLPHPNFYVVKEWKFGRYDTALAAHKWDALVMQPFGSTLSEDIEAITTFMNMALKNGAVGKFYIYATWPRRPRKPGGQQVEALPIDYAREWEQKVQVDDSDRSAEARKVTCSRDFYQRLVTAVRAAFPAVADKVFLIPAGEVIYDLNRKIIAGELPGLERVVAEKPALVPGWDPAVGKAGGANILYCDNVHFNPLPHKDPSLGILASGTTIFTVLSGENPVGLSAAAYGLDDKADADLIRAIQKTIWDVVLAEPFTGVTSAGGSSP